MDRARRRYGSSSRLVLSVGHSLRADLGGAAANAHSKRVSAVSVGTGSSRRSLELSLTLGSRADGHPAGTADGVCTALSDAITRVRVELASRSNQRAAGAEKLALAEIGCHRTRVVGTGDPSRKVALGEGPSPIWRPSLDQLAG